MYFGYIYAITFDLNSFDDFQKQPLKLNYMKDIFDVNETNQIIDRINSLQPSSQPIWGKMDVGQMLAHCNVPYESVYENKYPKPNGFTRFMLKMFVKSAVVGPKPYKKNGRTAPEFLITEQKEFESEKNRLINYINKTQELGREYFNNKESQSFGKLSDKEWNNLFSKHLDHHLKQFGQ